MGSVVLLDWINFLPKLVVNAVMQHMKDMSYWNEHLYSLLYVWILPSLFIVFLSNLFLFRCYLPSWVHLQLFLALRFNVVQVMRVNFLIYSEQLNPIIPLFAVVSKSFFSIEQLIGFRIISEFGIPVLGSRFGSEFRFRLYGNDGRFRRMDFLSLHSAAHLRFAAVSYFFTLLVLRIG